VRNKSRWTFKRKQRPRRTLREGGDSESVHGDQLKGSGKWATSLSSQKEALNRGKGEKRSRSERAKISEKEMGRGNDQIVRGILQKS